MDTTMTDIRQFLADNGADRKVLDTHMPEVVHHFRADRSGASVTVCEACAPPMPTESDWPCTLLKQMAAEFADRPGYDPEWKIDD
jgi:Family of unknown function (DUF6221)